MISFPGAPHLLRGGIVLIDAVTAAIQRVIVLQYNPDTITRTLQVRSVGEGADRSEALRLKGPAVETIKFDAEIDATDQLEFPKRYPVTAEEGLFASLAALETIVYPSTAQLLANNALAQQGTLEIAPMEAPLTLLTWSRHRVVPVRITDFSITEEAFDTRLNPIRAKVSLGMRVLSVDDLGFDHKGGSLYMVYQRQKEMLAGLAPTGSLGSLGIQGFP